MIRLCIHLNITTGAGNTCSKINFALIELISSRILECGAFMSLRKYISLMIVEFGTFVEFFQLERLSGILRSMGTFMQIEVLSNQIFICQHSTYHYTSVEVDFFLPKRMVPIATKNISNINNLTSDLANVVKKSPKVETFAYRCPGCNMFFNNIKQCFTHIQCYTVKHV